MIIIFSTRIVIKIKKRRKSLDFYQAILKFTVFLKKGRICEKNLWLISHWLPVRESIYKKWRWNSSVTVKKKKWWKGEWNYFQIMNDQKERKLFLTAINKCMWRQEIKFKNFYLGKKEKLNNFIFGSKNKRRKNVMKTVEIFIHNENLQEIIRNYNKSEEEAQIKKQEIVKKIITQIINEIRSENLRKGQKLLEKA